MEGLKVNIPKIWAVHKFMDPMVPPGHTKGSCFGDGDTQLWISALSAPRLITREEDRVNDGLEWGILEKPSLTSKNGFQAW